MVVVENDIVSFGQPLSLLWLYSLICDFCSKFCLSLTSLIMYRAVGGEKTQLLVFLFAEESLNCWSSSSWKTKIILHTQVRIHIRLLCPRFLVQFVISLSSVQDCHSRISTSDVERHSWWTLTSRWGLSWQSSETTNWYGHARWTSTLEFPNSHSLSVCSTWGLSHLFALLQGADGVEYLIVAVDASTLMDFLENEEGDWVDKTSDVWIISSRRCAAAQLHWNKMWAPGFWTV